MSAHTKGPWTVRKPAPGDTSWGVTDPDGYWIATAHNCVGSALATGETNAPLLAAAPDLLAALLELVACKELKDRIDAADLSLYSIADAERANDMQAEYDRRKPLAWEAARAAIAKATT